MKNLQIFVFLAIIALAASTGLWLNTQKCRFIRGSQDWHTFKISAYGGSGYYDFRYYDLPARWDYRGDDLLIPFGFRTGRYQVKVYVYDIYWRNSYSDYIILDLTQNNFENYRVYPRGQYDSNYNIKRIYEYQDRSYYTFPSYDKITELIQQGDVDELQGIILKTIDSDNQCDEKRQYLSGIISRIDRFLQVYERGIRVLESENARLRAELRRDEIQIKELRALISQSIASLNAQIREVEAKIALYEKRIRDDKQDIIQYRSDREQFDNKINKIVRVEIPELQSQIVELKYKLKTSTGSYCTKCYYYSRYYYSYEKSKYEDQIHRREKKIYYLREEVDSLRVKVTWFDKKIDNLQYRIRESEDVIQKLVYQRRALQIKIKEYKYDSDIFNKIDYLQREIIKIRSQIEKNEWEIQVNQRSSRVLENALKDFRMTIDRSYYTCQDYTYIRTQIVDDYYFRATFTPSVFRTYVQRGYDIDLFESSYYRSRVNRYISADQIYLARANVFSPYWYDSYGRAYDSYDYRYGSSLFSNRFQCRNDGQVYRGRISRISGRNIYARINDDEYHLSIGDCSSIDVATGYYVPKVNDYIFWRGYPTSRYNHNIYAGFCF